jgi:hypothetical protein
VYEWVKTKRGWRIFWGVDPLAGQPEQDQPEAAQTDTEDEDGQGSVTLPFRGREPGSDDRSAA